MPVRLSGSWNQLKVTPDFSGVQAALEAELKDKLLDEVTGRGGNSVGGVIGGILGQPPKTPATGTPPADGETVTPAEPAPPRDVEKELEDAAEKAARDALGGLFGRKRTTAPPAEPEPAPAEEDANALGALLAGERHDGRLGRRLRALSMTTAAARRGAGAHIDDVAPGYRAAARG